VLPEDDLDAERLMMSNVAVKYSVVSDLREAEPIEHSVTSPNSVIDGFNSYIPSKRTLLPEFTVVGAG
jgi:hypothetical protein